MNEEAHLLVEHRRDGVMVLTMNRPGARNALSPQMLVLMAEAWHEYRDNSDLRVAILTGVGDEDFCAGGDLKLTMPLITGARQPEDDWDHRLMGDLTQATDLRVASDNAVFGTPEARVGLLPGGGSLTRLARQVPWARAMEILMLGEPFDAATALDMGLLNYVVPRGEALKRALELASVLADCGPLAVQKIKEGILRSSGLPLADAFKIEDEVSMAVMTSKDAREGPRAFKEKRKPLFTGE